MSMTYFHLVRGERKEVDGRGLCVEATAASQGPQKKIVIHHQIVKNGETKQFLADRVKILGRSSMPEDAGRQEDEPTTTTQQRQKITTQQPSRVSPHDV